MLAAVAALCCCAPAKLTVSRMDKIALAALFLLTLNARGVSRNDARRDWTAGHPGFAAFVSRMSGAPESDGRERASKEPRRCRCLPAVPEAGIERDWRHFPDGSRQKFSPFLAVMHLMVVSMRSRAVCSTGTHSRLLRHPARD